MILEQCDEQGFEKADAFSNWLSQPLCRKDLTTVVRFLDSESSRFSNRD
jgi:hypothetical protein